MKIYISGPMTGIPQYNSPAFFAAADTIALNGHEPINPAEHVTETDKPWEWFMRKDLRLLLDADAVCLLPGWALSPGATLEAHVALSLGMRLFKLLDDGLRELGLR